MRRYCQDDADMVLYVDDVLTTGASMDRIAKLVGAPRFCGAVLFSRTANPPHWITPLFTLSAEVGDD